MSRPLQIFLAEDNPGDVTLVRVALQFQKVQHVLQVAHLRKDVEALLERMGNDLPSPDCIVLDLHLPDISGLDILNKFRSRPDMAEVPVIVISSSKSPADQDRAEKAGIEHYFPKPLSLQEYLRLGELILEVTMPRLPEIDRRLAMLPA